MRGRDCRHFCSDPAVTEDLSRVDSTELASRETCSMRSGIMLRLLILQFARGDYVKMPARLLVWAHAYIAPRSIRKYDKVWTGND